MEAEGDDIYTLTVPLTGDTVEFKFAIGAWDDQEDLEPETSCTKTTYDEGAPNGCCFVNRIVVLGGEDAIEMLWSAGILVRIVNLLPHPVAPTKAHATTMRMPLKTTGLVSMNHVQVAPTHWLATTTKQL